MLSKHHSSLRSSLEHFVVPSEAAGTQGDFVTKRLGIVGQIELSSIVHIDKKRLFPTTDFTTLFNRSTGHQDRPEA